MEKIRIQKFFTDNGILSRRAAEREISSGRVRINGKQAAIGQKIDPGRDRVEHNGRVIEPPVLREFTYIMLNKPRGFLSSASDDRGRPCVTDLTRDCGLRVYPVGRLDMDTEGLLLLTDDGDLAYRLTHPKHEIPKVYHLTVRGNITNQQILRLSQPFLLDGYTTSPAAVSRLSCKRGDTLLELTIHEGRNRQVRRMCEACGLELTRLRRVALGALPLGNLPAGRWRRLTPAEVGYLKGEVFPLAPQPDHK